MALLRLRYEAECLISQLTKQNPGGQPPDDARPKPPLPRERFSPLTHELSLANDDFRVANHGAMLRYFGSFIFRSKAL
jgi:hypothetical protein